MSRITTHVLDQSLGRPAGGVEIVLFAGEEEVARGRTNADGRIGDWADVPGIRIGKLRFETGEYFKRLEVATFYPFVEVYFEITAEGHYHIPLLLSPWGYSTYRGS
ncbi:MAG: hydroxyisourate hydrolase [Bacteroidetes bacterium]|nr:hydroxyisourate hydrolase [Bacteroidota bacterium]